MNTQGNETKDDFHVVSCLSGKKMSYTSNSSNGLPLLYTSFFLPLSLGKRMMYNALHPISKKAVLPMVTSTKLVGGGWPIVIDLMIIPNCMVRGNKLNQTCKNRYRCSCSHQYAPVKVPRVNCKIILISIGCWRF